MKKLLLAAGLALLAACSDATSPNRVGTESLKPSATLASGNNTVVVREADIARQAESNPTPTRNWVFYTRNAATGAFIDGPSTPPLGTGSFQISTPTGNDKGFLFNFDHTGTAISTITAISYSTYVSTPGSSDARQAPSINIQIDKNGGAFEVGDFSTLVFEPVYNTTQGNVTVGSWQTWDAYASGTASWWMTNSALCPAAATLCTWSDVLANYPNATIIGGFGINQGSGNGGLAAAVDALTLGYGGNSITYNFEDSNCHWSDAGSVRTLLGDCQTSSTILIPDGMTFDGDGHTITAVDPASPAHFLGAVIANEGPTANVTNLTITTANLADVCDGGVDRLRGILFDGASGSITNNVVTNLRQGPSGCQEGNAIEVRNAPFDDTGSDVSVTISGNVVSNYQKTGILTNGSVSAAITGNTITGAGPVNYIAQNGIQVGFGATAIVKNNRSSGNNYTGADLACGLLLYQADGVKASANTLFNNEKDMCNYGKGGGNVKPSN